jgi:hypothetical protein
MAGAFVQDFTNPYFNAIISLIAAPFGSNLLILVGLRCYR